MATISTIGNSASCHKSCLRVICQQLGFRYNFLKLTYFKHVNMSQTKLCHLFFSTLAVLYLAVLPAASQAKEKSLQTTKERLVLMPLHVPEEDKSLQIPMEAALVKGLQQKYEIFSGEQVSKKAKDIFNKESRSSKVECDETRCMQSIAEAFQAELIATTNIAKRGDGYFLALIVQNVFDNKVVYSNAIPCKRCDAFQVLEQLNQLSTVQTVDASPVMIVATEPQNKMPVDENIGNEVTQVALFKDCMDCPEMVTIPPGSFDMGSSDSEIERFDNEGPVHRVNVRQFAMGKTEITKDQFAAFVTATGYVTDDSCWTFEAGKYQRRSERNWRDSKTEQSGSYPVSCVNWHDAKAYAEWLSHKTGKQYRLPTEAEWEYAERGNTKSARFWGGNPDQACEYANVADTITQSKVQGAAAWAAHNCSDGYAYAAPVGSFKPNAFGLYDMLGNVFELLEDSWQVSYRDAPTDGSARLGISEKHSMRGGSWSYGPQYIRSAYRGRIEPETRSDNIGFRIARTLP